MTRSVPKATLSFLIALLTAGAAIASRGEDQQPGPSVAKEVPRPETPVPEAKTWVTQHTITLGGAPLAFTATAGTMQITNDKDEPVALFGYTAYTKDGADRATRPIVFAYNGGPGSASAWLHMGILGPKRTKLDDLEWNTRGPFRIVENEHTILDRVDGGRLVLVCEDAEGVLALKCVRY